MNRDSKIHQGRGKSPSQRQLRVGEELRHALARILGRDGLRDPALLGTNLTVTEVRVSPDLKNATAFVMPLGGAELETKVEALNRAAGFIRGQLARDVKLRYTPKIGFQADRSFDYAHRIGEILDRPKVQRDVLREAGEGGGDGA